MPTLTQGSAASVPVTNGQYVSLVSGSVVYVAGNLATVAPMGRL